MKKSKTRKGMTLIELVVALLLMALAIVVMGRLTATRIAGNESLEYQYTMQAAEGALYNIYQDFHECRDLSITHSTYAAQETDKDVNGDGVVDSNDTTPANVTMISFDLGAAGSHTYSFDDFLYTFYYNGASQFKCEAFEVNGNTQHLFVSIRLANGERLEYTIYS